MLTARKLDIYDKPFLVSLICDYEQALTAGFSGNIEDFLCCSNLLSSEAIIQLRKNDKCYLSNGYEITLDEDAYMEEDMPKVACSGEIFEMGEIYSLPKKWTLPEDKTDEVFFRLDITKSEYEDELNRLNIPREEHGLQIDRDTLEWRSRDEAMTIIRDLIWLARNRDAVEG
jgi:hypothetical protein